MDELLGKVKASEREVLEVVAEEKEGVRE